MMYIATIIALAIACTIWIMVRRYRKNRWKKHVTCWYKADKGALNADGKPAADGEAVHTWVDQSGGGFFTRWWRGRKNNLHGETGCAPIMSSRGVKFTGEEVPDGDA